MLEVGEAMEGAPEGGGAPRGYAFLDVGRQLARPPYCLSSRK